MATKPEETQEVPKRSTLQTVVEDGLLRELVSGDIWKLEDAEIKAHKETLDKFRKLCAAAFKMFDEELTNRRNINGAEYLKEVNHFRKPRTSGSDDSLLKDLDF
jgi:molybdopterin converting factor small subunit